MIKRINRALPQRVCTVELCTTNTPTDSQLLTGNVTSQHGRIASLPLAPSLISRILMSIWRSLISRRSLARSSPARDVISVAGGARSSRQVKFINICVLLHHDHHYHHRIISPPSVTHKKAIRPGPVRMCELVETRFDVR